MATKDELGRRGEQLAHEHLVARGLEILDRNWRCALGEIDLVARDEGCLVFVEVKTRSGAGWGEPLEAITPLKLARLRRLAAEWCDAHPEARGALRIDAIGIVLPHRGRSRLEHVEAVF